MKIAQEPENHLKDKAWHARRNTGSRRFSGEAVYQIPVGPVHAGIIEPGHFRFSVIGETIFNLEIRMFYKHRGLEKIAEGKTPQECLETRRSHKRGRDRRPTLLHSVMQSRKYPASTSPKSAWHLRTVLLRLNAYTRTSLTLREWIIDVAYPAGATPLQILREEILRPQRIYDRLKVHERRNWHRWHGFIGISHKPLADYSHLP